MIISGCLWVGCIRVKNWIVRMCVGTKVNDDNVKYRLYAWEVNAQAQQDSLGSWNIH